VKAWTQLQVEKSSPLDPEDAAVFAGGGESIELEKLRCIKRQREELAYQRDLGTVVELGAVRPKLLDLARRLRESATVLVKKFGNDAGDIISECLEEFNADVDRGFADDPANDGPAAAGDGPAVEAKPAKKHKAVRRRRNRHPKRAVRKKKVQGS
jgi:hypothetical protein